MIRVNLTLTIIDKRKLEIIREKRGISMSELLRHWIDREFNLYCPHCVDGNHLRCIYYDVSMPTESRCITDSSIGYCIFEKSEE